MGRDAMATDPLTIALVSAGSSVAASLLTIWLTPSLQHYFWKRQRLAEMRIDTIDEFNRLAAEFLFGYSSAPNAYKPSADWFTAFLSVTAKIKAHFPQSVFDAFKAVDVLIGPGTPGLGPEGQGTIEDFMKARDAALRALYAEVVRIRQ
jgi:hypothetical protein